jgi:hypothetical protein
LKLPAPNSYKACIVPFKMLCLQHSLAKLQTGTTGADEDPGLHAGNRDQIVLCANLKLYPWGLLTECIFRGITPESGLA